MANLKSLSKNLYGESSRNAMLALFESSEFLRWFETTGGWELDATDFDYWTISAAANLQAFAEGGSISTVQDLTVDSKQTNSLKFYGDAFKVSNTRKLDASAGLRSVDVWLDKKRKAVYRSFAKALTKAIFTHDGTSNTMTGFAKRIDGSTRLPGYTDTNNFTDLEAKRALTGKDFSADTSPTSIDLTKETNYDGFWEMFYTAVSLMDGTKGLVIPDFAKPRITTMARKAGLLGSTANFEKEMQTIGGIPLITVPNDVITRTEAENKASTPATICTSFYMLAPEEQRCSLVTNSGLWYYEHDHRENEEKGLEQMGINLQLKIEDNKSVLRMMHIKI